MSYQKISQGLDTRKIAIILLAGVLGLSTGFAASQLQDTKEPYCDRIESQVMEERNISGNLACFEPGLVQINLSEEVENNSELRCVCRHEYRGIEQLIPISFSN